MPYSEIDPTAPIRKIDPLLSMGAFGLSAVAGFSNCVILEYYHIPISHMTGAVSMLGIDLAESRISEIGNIIFIIIGFVIGAIISGVVIHGPQLKPKSEYGYILILESFFIAAAALFLSHKMNFGLFCAALAFGLQNAMASSYYGLIIRTTHVTGIVTDIGVLIGHGLRRRRFKSGKIFFLFLILSGFLSGGFLGIRLFFYFQLFSLFLPAASCLVAGILFLFLLKSGRILGGPTS